MKTTLIKLLALSGIAVLLMPACKKSDTLVTSNGGQAGALTVNSTSPALNKANVADTKTQVVTFTFTNATYNFTAAVTNTLQIDAVGDNWVHPTSVSFASGVLTQSYDTYDFDNLLLKLGLKGGVATTVNVRLVQTLSSQVAPIYSNVLTLNVTPFNLTAWIYVAGQLNGWSATNPDSLISATSNGIYTGVLNFPAGNNQFLILPAKNFNTKYATNDSSTPSATVFLSTGSGNNLNAPAAAGQYLVTLNTNNNTISFALADYYSVIGDAAQGWSTDIPMKYTNDANSTWTLTTTLNTTGSFKVRQDFAWTNSWGIPQAGSEGAGVANTLNDTKNNNIAVSAAGSYKINFIMPISAIGPPAVTPLVTTTYSATKVN